MIHPSVSNEFSKIKKVVLGISDDFGGCPTLEQAYDPKSKENITKGTFPKELDIAKELTSFLNLFNQYGVEVLRPQNIFNCNQIFARDVGFVIEDSFFISNIIDKRSHEILGFESILKQINTSKIIEIPKDIFIEGGDVILGGDYLFIGYSDKIIFNNHEVSRTNKEALDFLTNRFPNKHVIGFELFKSDNNPYENCLHLDCCFQPLGLGHVIIYPHGFQNKSDLDLINQIFGKNNVININQDEMYNMFSNIFSISNNVIVSDVKFTRLNNILRNRGYIVEEISFSETSKMGGLFRCTTLPLTR